MADTEKTAPTAPTETVHWRLPTRVASDNGGDWTALREHLTAWAESGEHLEVDPPDETKNVCLRVPSKMVKALEKEAARLTKKHGKRWTAGRVARELWDQWEPS